MGCTMRSTETVTAFWEDVWNAHDPDAVDRFVDDDIVVEIGGREVSGENDFHELDQELAGRCQRPAPWANLSAFCCLSGSSGPIWPIALTLAAAYLSYRVVLRVLVARDQRGVRLDGRTPARRARPALEAIGWRSGSAARIGDI
jgi:hypothetical protein